MDMFSVAGTPSLAGALDRVHLRKAMQRAGLVDEPQTSLPSDPAEVAEVLGGPSFDEDTRELAQRLGRPLDEVRAEAAGHLRGMSATHSERASRQWRRFSQFLARAYDVYVDDDSIATLKRLDRKNALVFLFSHRSYLDGTLVPEIISSRGITSPYTFAGANLNFFPLGPVVSRSGAIFIRRSTSDVPVYRWALRSYIGQLIRGRANLAWSIEGGRTRTGKLRPPAFGILRYVLDAAESVADSDVLVVPVSVVYDQLHEVSLMTSEAVGGHKRPEDFRWLVRFAREQKHRLGRAYLEFGEPMPLRERMAELRGDDPDAPHAVERIALDTCHRINRATPVTATAVVSLAMLGADRALSMGGVLATVAPLAEYLTSRDRPVAGAANLTDRSTIRRALQDLVASGVLSCYDGGTDTVWGIAPEQHLVAAFYRNCAIHVFVERAIGELALVAGAENGDGDLGESVRAEALGLRELLKFDFFFSGRDAFGDELETELRLLERGEGSPVAPRDLLRRLAGARPHVAHLVLRPFLDAYHVVADRLAEWDLASGTGVPHDTVDEKAFLDECLRVGKQWALQRRIANAESVTLELFKTALRLARHRDLVDADDPTLAKRRADFVAEIADAVRRCGVIADLAKAEAAGA